MLVADAVLAKPQSWRPVGLRWPILSGIVIACLALIIGLQVLLGAQDRNGGVFFAPTPSDISLSHSFIYLYMPVIFSGAVSLMWAWVDNDSKRAEPFYQLSKPAGETGQNTVLLDYSTDFIALIPFRALRRG